ncbi:MAG: LemA family protein [Propionibacteriaceae bacterium]|jgi:LemA protein|nr:LemA family protein [Propionibacteriaceae bacterium]
MSLWLLVVVGVAAVVVLIGVLIWALYNRLTRLGVRADEAWSDMTVQLKRRADLIPNLVEAVRAYAAHERTVFEEVSAARASMLNASNEGPQALAGADNLFEGALKSLFAVAEAYPELKANHGFQQLRQELVNTEDKIQASRRFYNGSVRDLNTKIRTCPANLFAGGFGFTQREFFEPADRAGLEEPVALDFS